MLRRRITVWKLSLRRLLQPTHLVEVHDPAEYDAYIAAVQQKTNSVSALESFLQKYPNSMMKEDVLNH